MTLDELFAAHYDAGFPDDDTAFFRGVQDAVETFLRSRVSPASFDDAVQEAMIVVVNKRKELTKEGGSFRGWVFTVAQRQALSQGRQQQRRSHEPLPEGSLWARVTGLLTLLGRLEQRAMLREQLETGLRTISTALRRTALLKLDGLDNEEIAALEGITVETVSTRLHRLLHHHAFRRVVAALS
ncbi:MAG: sigma-70 family RNA polymerase sigma factor [Deltaproteobacteria bacterium]|nr:sigma-70 family RNA polymerase sigma factor [Deltaproteobacteria bacterium]